jgi:hypothetical protein
MAAEAERLLIRPLDGNCKTCLTQTGLLMEGLGQLSGVNICNSGFIMRHNFALNYTFGSVPDVHGLLGQSDSDNNPIPFLNCGRIDVVGSIHYFF